MFGSATIEHSRTSELCLATKPLGGVCIFEALWELSAKQDL